MAILWRAVIAALGSALIWAGVGPVGHLHPATLAHPTIVHAHVEGVARTATHAATSVHDEHDDAVPLGLVIAVGPVTQAAGQLAVLRPSSWAPAVEPLKVVRLDADAVRPPSPPPRPHAPRGPPA